MTGKPRLPSRERRAGLGAQGLATALGLVINGVSRFAMSWAVGRLLGAAALGAFQSGIAASKIGSLFGPGALGTAASSFIARHREDEPTRSAIIAHLKRRYLQSTCAISIVTATVWAAVVGGSAATGVAVVILTIGISGYTFSRGILYGDGRVLTAVRWSNITSLVGLALVMLGALAGVPNELLVLALGLSYFVFIWAHRTPRNRAAISRPLRKEIDHFIGFVIAGTLASTGFLEASMLLAAATGSSHEAGHYGAAFVLATPASLIGAAASLVLFPQLSSTPDSIEKARVVSTASKSMAALLVPAFAVLILLREEIVASVWGPGFDRASHALGPLLLAILLSSLAIPAVNALTAGSARGVRISALSSWCGAVTGVLVWLVTVPSHSIEGIAYGFLAGTLVMSVGPFVIVWRSSQLPWAVHASQLLLFCTFLAILPWLQGELGTSTIENIWLMLAFCATWAVATWRDQKVLLSSVARGVKRSG